MAQHAVVDHAARVGGDGRQDGQMVDDRFVEPVASERAKFIPSLRDEMIAAGHRRPVAHERTGGRDLTQEAAPFGDDHIATFAQRG